jgi:hypothetical protein
MFLVRLRAVLNMLLILIVSFIANGGPVIYETRYFLALISGMLLVYTAYNPTAFFPHLQ